MDRAWGKPRQELDATLRQVVGGIDAPTVGLQEPEELELLVSGKEPPATLPSIVRPRGRGRPVGVKAIASSSSWLALRRRVRAAMQARGLDAAALARELAEP